MAKRFSNLRHPGDGYNHVNCEVCGKKIFSKDAILITDRYNLLFGRLVCQADADETNGQAYPFRAKDELVSDARFYRPKDPETSVVNENSSRVPSAPLNLVAYAGALDAQVELRWTGPFDSGSDPIIGYVIARAAPQESYQFIINANTQSQATYYVDTDASLDLTYSYSVAAINAYGTGPYSELAYFPTKNVPDEIGISYAYLLQSDTNYTILDGSDRAIIVRI